MRSHRLAGPLVAIAIFASAPTALAQEPGVTIDPDSPSAKEYEIPLERARRSAQPARDPRAPVQQVQRAAPLFGAGITPAAGAQRDGRTRRAPRAASPAARERKRAELPAVVRVAVANPGAPDGGTGTSVFVIAAAALALGAGAGVGALARRRDRSARG